MRDPLAMKTTTIMSNKKHSGFTKGSGCYTCTSCKTLTRDDGYGDSVHVQLCTACYELGGLENLVQDGNAEPSDLLRIDELNAEILKRQQQQAPTAPQVSTNLQQAIETLQQVGANLPQAEVPANRAKEAAEVLRRHLVTLQALLAAADHCITKFTPTSSK